MKFLKRWGLWIAAICIAIFIAIRLWFKYKKRDEIITEWIDVETEHKENIRKLEKISRAQAIEAKKELDAIDLKYKEKKEALDEEIYNGQTTVANAWNRYFRAKRAATVPSP